jgi:hypothetical protein
MSEVTLGRAPYTDVISTNHFVPGGNLHPDAVSWGPKNNRGFVWRQLLELEKKISPKCKKGQIAFQSFSQGFETKALSI